MKYRIAAVAALTLGIATATLRADIIEQVLVKVNGEITVEATLPYEAKAGRTLSSGTMAIQGHDPGSIVYFRSIRVKPLD